MNTKQSRPAAALRQVQAHEESQWLSIASRRVANGVQPSGEQRKTKRKSSRRSPKQSVCGGGKNQRVMNIGIHRAIILDGRIRSTMTISSSTWNTKHQRRLWLTIRRALGWYCRMSAIVLGRYRSAYTESDMTSSRILDTYRCAPSRDITVFR